MFLLLLTLSNPAGSEEALVFIVNSENPISSLSIKEINQLFMKQKREWPNGDTVRFIDRKSSPSRKLFLKTVLKKNEEEVDRFWIGQKLYTGDSAPAQSPSDSMSIQFVAAFKGAIGYLSSSTVVNNKSVKVIKTTD